MYAPFVHNGMHPLKYNAAVTTRVNGHNAMASTRAKYAPTINAMVKAKWGANITISITINKGIIIDTH